MLRRTREAARARGRYTLVLAMLVTTVVYGLWPSSADPGATLRFAAPAASSVSVSSAVASSDTAAGSAGVVHAVPVAYTTVARAGTGLRTITFRNALKQTIWLATTKDASHALTRTGWVLRPGQSVSIRVPGSKWGARFWGRTGCHFNSAGRGHCETGDCGGVFQCTGSGATPATLAELALGAWGGMDFYDVSMVDGANLPMYINISGGGTKDPVSPSGCVKAGCTKAVVCPGKMQYKVGGRVVGCKNPCTAFGGDTYCCRGAWAGREKCIPSHWPVDYTKVFKKAEPYAYSYAFDDSATMPCKGRCDYRITFGITPRR